VRCIKCHRGIIFCDNNIFAIDSLGYLHGEKVRIFDTTLRDGEQTPGVSITLESKLKITNQLDRLGVSVIEAGFPSSSKAEMDAVSAVVREGLSADICGLARVLKPDIDVCLDAGVDVVHVFVSTSDIQREATLKKSREEVKQMVMDAVSHVREHGVACLFSAMDASRTPRDYLLEINRTAVDAGAGTVNIPDTVGVMVPFTMRQMVAAVAEAVDVVIDVHCHNDFGLAVSNTLAGVEAGARQVQVTVNGLGERAGNADIAQVVMSLEALYGMDTGIETKYLLETSKLVERLSGISYPPTSPVVGENAFAHESGIHAHGVIINSETFEPGVMTPEMVGQRRRLVAGKHAGKHSIEKMLVDAGMKPSSEELAEIVDRVKELGAKGKIVTDLDLYVVADTVMGSRLDAKRKLVLKEVSVMTGNRITPTAVVRLMVNGDEHVGSGSGVGPVDAALQALVNGVGENARVRLMEFRMSAITGGANALAEVIIGVEDSRGRRVTARATREDIVMASVEAMVEGINRLLIMP